MSDCLAKPKSVFGQEIKEKVKSWKQNKISRANGDLKSELHRGKLSLLIFQIAIILTYFN